MIEYRGFFIQHDPKPIPTRAFDWDWWADGYDGAPDSHDPRCGAAATEQAARDEIDDLLLDLKDSLWPKPRSAKTAID